MPLQKPSSRSISMSNWVRWRSRCDSSSLPCASSSLRARPRARRGSPPPRARSSAVGGVVGRRPDADVLELLVDLAGERVEVLDRLDLVAEEPRAEGRLGVGREHLERLAAHAERAAGEHLVVAPVLDVDELAQDLVAVDHLALLERDHLGVVLLRRAHAVDARDGGDDDHVPAGEQRAGGGVAQPVDLLVDRGVLLDVQVLRGTYASGW